MDIGADIVMSGATDGDNPFAPSGDKYHNDRKATGPPKIFLRHGNLGAQKALSPYDTFTMASQQRQTHF